MGWKTLKERFKIDLIVHMRKNIVCIGPYMMPDAVMFNAKTGKMLPESEGWIDNVKRHCPELFKASPKEIRDAMKAEDTFERSIPVYTFTWDECRVIEKLCEDTGYPNVTHDGVLMHENHFSTDRLTAVRRAHQLAFAKRRGARTIMGKLEEQISTQKEELARYELAVEALEAELNQ